MTRLYGMDVGADAVGRWAHANQRVDAPVTAETVEGGTGLVVCEVAGLREVGAMSWGFPRLTREMRLRGDPPGRIGLVADLTNPMWERVAVDPRHRCLIPMTRFANPGGEPGAKTRTWFSVRDEPLVAWAGFWRDTSEFEPVYSGMTMTANGAVKPFNDRMPALLAADEHERWLHGTVGDVIAFQFREPIASERLSVQPTRDLWRNGAPPVGGDRQFALL